MKKIDQKICKISYIVCYDKNIYESIKKIKVNNDVTVDVILDDYIFCHSENLSDMKIAIQDIKRYHPNVTITSILNFIDDNNIEGSSYKKIIKFINNNKDKENKNQTIKYHEFLFLLDELRDGGNKFFKQEYIEQISKNINEIKFLYMQNNFNKYFEKHKKLLYDVSPITVDYINSSIKNDYYSKEDGYYIVRIGNSNDNKILKNYYNKVFNENTSINKELMLLKNILVANILIFSFMLSVVFVYYKIYLRG